MTRNIKQLVSQMTLEEKAAMCSGADFWTTKANDRLDIPAVMLTDGPHGLRKQAEGADHLGLTNSVPATCFPSAAGLACTWDEGLLQEVGQALGVESRAEGVAVLLGPGTNIKRSPLCGRNFEYFSEDPYLASRLAAAHIRGVQSQDVGASLKHFAVNNQEHRRMTVDAQVDERTLREIYLAAFEYAVKEAQPWTVMCSYNQVNGTFAAEHPYLLTDVLRQEWGFKGFVVSDWGAVNQRVPGLQAGMDLEMPGSGGINDAKIVQAVRSGELAVEVLDTAVERILRVFYQFLDSEVGTVTFDQRAHHQLARRVAAESAVLLQNNDALLPLASDSSIALIGAFAEQPRYQGSGSSRVNPTQLETLKEELEKYLDGSGELHYAPGFSLEEDSHDDALLEEAVRCARTGKTVVLCLGLPHAFESEGFDRTHMRLPNNQLAVLDAITRIKNDIVVVLSGGSPVEMPWAGHVKSILNCYLGGQAAGGAAADVLMGAVNPAGRLAETYPVRLQDNPSYLNFPGEGDVVQYREGVFVGYRYYDAKEVRPLFAFGHGLSYTEFELSNLRLDKEQGTDKDVFTVSVDVTNVGQRAGQEVVQLYVAAEKSSVVRPPKELRAFAKVAVEPGQTVTVNMTLDRRAFAYYSASAKDWWIESGCYGIMVGHASDNLPLQTSIQISSSQESRPVFHRNSTLGDLLQSPYAREAGLQLLQGMLAGMGMDPAKALDGVDSDPMGAIVKDMPLRCLVNFGRGRFTDEQLTGLLQQINA